MSATGEKKLPTHRAFARRRKNAAERTRFRSDPEQLAAPALFWFTRKPRVGAQSA